MATPVAPALRALLTNAIDYAGMFPPAQLPFEQALREFEEHQRDPHAWMLGRFVIGAADLARLPAGASWGASVLSDRAIAGRAESIETKSIQRFVPPTYCEIPCRSTQLLQDIQQAGAYAKIRMSGAPPARDVAEFLGAAARLRVPFKATAGLHHPIRSLHAGVMMHGFVNVLLGAAFAWHGLPVEEVEAILNETDSAAFAFDDEARWRGQTLGSSQIHDAREQFVHSFGSCSFAEPLEDLQSLGWLA